MLCTRRGSVAPSLAECRRVKVRAGLMVESGG